MHVSIPEMPLELAAGELETRYVEYGDMAIRHARVPAGGDMAPLLAGLPDGTEETVSEGEVYHWAPGHTGVTENGVTFLEIGPCGPMRQFGEHARTILGA